MKKILRTLCCLLLLAACAANAADYKEAFRKLAARAAEQSPNTGRADTSGTILIPIPHPCMTEEMYTITP